MAASSNVDFRKWTKDQFDLAKTLYNKAEAEKARSGQPKDSPKGKTPFERCGEFTQIHFLNMAKDQLSRR